MAKHNRTERLLSEWLHSQNNLWFLKLHNNPLAHQTTPSDFLVLSKAIDAPDYLNDVDVNVLNAYLVECKECTCSNEQGRWHYDRLTQIEDMIRFQKYSSRCISYLFITFHDTNWMKSDIYLIPIDMYIAYLPYDRQSLNRKDFKDIFIKYKIEYKIKDGINLNSYFI